MNDDCISRAVVLDALREIRKDTHSVPVYNAISLAIIEVIAAPSVSPQVVHSSPCDLCRFTPPSSCDGKPCTMCPAEDRIGGEDDA